MKAVWLPDPHLNFLTDVELWKFLGDIVSAEPDCVLIGGDIGEAHNVHTYLKELEDILKIPIYIVLGNHDFYKGSITSVTWLTKDFCNWSPYTHWLGDYKSNPIRLTKKTGLIGHGCWGDARLGEPLKSTVILADFEAIKEFIDKDRLQLASILNRLGEEAADFIQTQLIKAIADYENVIILTHVPPFIEAAVHMGKICEPGFLPYFSCKAVGDVIMDIAKHTDSQITVLCGHTHSSGKVQLLPNLTVITGESRYGDPSINILEIE